MELERRDQPVPRVGVVDAGVGSVERRRRAKAVAADLDARGHLQGASPAARHDRREARRGSRRRRGRGPSLRRRRTGSASAAPPPRCAARAVREGGGCAGIGSIYCPPWMATIARAGAASIAVAVERALRRMVGTARAALAASARWPVAWPSAWRRCGWSPSACSIGVPGPGAGARRCEQRYPKAEIVAVEPDASWLARASRSSGRRWWPLGRARAASAHAAGEPDARPGPGPSRLGQHGAARRRRPAGAVRALARTARGRRLRRVLLPRPGHACASCASSTPRSAGRRRRPASSTCTISATCWSPPASPTRCSTRRR